MMAWIPFVLGFLYQFSRGRAMQKSLVFVVDVGKWLAALVLLVVLGCWAERTPLFPNEKPAKPEAEKQKKRILPILRGELDDLQSNAPGGTIQLGDKHPPDGSRVQIDFPLERDMRNIGSRVDGAGMCVSTSAEMAADWSGLLELKGWRDWCAREPGGSYMEKFDRQIKQFCKSKNIPVPNYLFYMGKDPEILKTALASGRMPAVSYAGQDGVQYRGPIAHCVNAVHYQNDWVGVYDNNYDPRRRIWLSESEFLKRWAPGRSLGWVIVWLDPPPPPAVQP